MAEKNLSLKANRALFSIKQSIFDKDVRPSVILNIFERLVKPIALYGSEIWGAYKPCYKGKALNEMFEMSFKSMTKYMQSFVNIYLAYILKHVTLQLLVNLAVFLYCFQLLLVV